MLMMAKMVGMLGGAQMLSAPIAEAFYTPSSAYPPSGAPTRIVVPPGASHMRLLLIGAAGGAGAYNSGPYWSGPGGYAYGTLPVNPGEEFDVFIGQGGQGASSPVPAYGGYGGWPNGGHGTYGDTYGGGGGGRTEVRRVSGSASILIAGGGGGIANYSGNGGSGGGTSGAAGANGGGAGGGGTQTAGGGLGAGKYQGGFNSAGVEATYPFGPTALDGGGGGDGWYGGGPSASDGCPGGGGSGYVSSELTSAATTQSDTSSARHSSIPATLYGFSTGTFGNPRQGVTSGVAPNGNNGFAVIAFNGSAVFPA